MANLLHSKGTRNKVLSGFPTNNFGNDGDIVVVSAKGRGVYLCIKSGNRWHAANKLQDLQKLEKTSIKDLKLEKLRIGGTTITSSEYDVLSGDFTLDVAGNIILEATTSINSDTPLKIKEAAAAVADTTAYGQLWVKTATPNELYFTTDAGNDIQITSGTATAFVGDITGVTAGTNCSGGGTSGAVTINVDDAFIKNDANDIMLGTLTIKSETADQFKVLYDLDNYALLNVSATGDLEIETVGAGTTDSDITLNADGAIKLDAGNIVSGQGIQFLLDGTTVGQIAGHHGGTHLQLYENIGASTDDFFNIDCGANGETEIITYDAGGTAAHLLLAPDGDLILNPKEGKFIAQKDGTEFSAADSAYAGMILGYTRIANDGTGGGDPYITMDGTMTVLQTVDASTNVSIAFVVPPSGNVEIQFSCYVYASSRTVGFALSDNTTFNEIGETHTYDAGVQASDETDHNSILVSFAVTGLTAGASLTYYIAGVETSSGTTLIKHGRYRDSGTHFPPIIVKAIALPATIVTGG